MGLQQKLDAFKAEFLRTAPAGQPALYETKIDELRASFALNRAISNRRAGARVHSAGSTGKGCLTCHLIRVSGPAVVTFYRGGWCPYCNIQLRAYQAVLPAMTALGTAGRDLAATAGRLAVDRRGERTDLRRAQ